VIRTTWFGRDRATLCGTLARIDHWMGASCRDKVAHGAEISSRREDACPSISTSSVGDSIAGRSKLFQPAADAPMVNLTDEKSHQGSGSAEAMDARPKCTCQDDHNRSDAHDCIKNRDGFGTDWRRRTDSQKSGFSVQASPHDAREM